MDQKNTIYETRETFTIDFNKGSFAGLDKSFEQRLAHSYQSLSKRLREAGDFITDNPIDVATRSLRSVAQDAGLPPATFSRLARDLGYESFEQVRDDMRAKISRRVDSFADRADRLLHDHEGGSTDFFTAHQSACQTNIAALTDDVDSAQLGQVVDRLRHARKVSVMGALGSRGIAEYMLYIARFLSDTWGMLDGDGASLGSGLAGLSKGDALIILTKPPFAQKGLVAAEIARQKGVFVIVITDSHTCPALRHADAALMVKSHSPHFYSSYVATVCLIESLIGMLAAQAGPDVQRRISEIETQSRRLQEVRDG